MGESLTRQRLASHGHFDEYDGAGREVWTVKVDHAVLDPATAMVAIAALEGIDPVRSGPEITMMCANERKPSAALPSGSAASLLLGAARAYGVHYARPGSGGGDIVYRERFAAPGRLAMVSAGEPSAAGALGVVTFAAAGLEAAEVLRSGELRREFAGVLPVRIHGSIPRWVSGVDVALDLGRRLRAETVRGRVIEFCGAGVATLSFADRVALTLHAIRWWACPALFPSDDVTRRVLDALGREADWKRMESGPNDHADALDLDLDGVEPRVASAGGAGASRRVRQATRLRIARIWIGPSATYADLARLARVLAGRHVHDGTDVAVEPGSRTIHETAVRFGVLATLERSGVRIVRDGMPLGSTSRPVHGADTLCFGLAAPSGPSELDAWLTSLETCAASALSGRLADPRELDVDFERHEEPERYVVETQWVAKPAGDASIRAGEKLPRVARGQRLDRPLRGTILFHLEARVSEAPLLRRGAVMEPHGFHVPALAAHAFSSEDSEFPSRARAHGGGFVVGGNEFGAGERDDVGALVLRELGVRAVFARSFDEGFHRSLVHAGILASRIASDVDAATLVQGDEIEMPGLPEALEPGVPIVVRNLTRGSQITVSHALDERDVQRVLAGGILEHGCDESQRSKRRETRQRVPADRVVADGARH